MTFATTTNFHFTTDSNKSKAYLSPTKSIAFIYRIFVEKYKLPRKWISGLDKAPKGKKKRW